MAIVTHHPLLLHQLRYPQPARIKVWRGAATLKSGGVSIELGEGEAFTVPPFVRFSCLAHPRMHAGGSRAAVWSLALETDCSTDMQSAADASKPAAQRLAAAILAAPARRWNAADVAADWQITPARLRAQLFAEGESLRCLVSEQRVAWVLAQLADMSGDAAKAAAAYAATYAATYAASSGFASAAAMARACQDLIGLPPEIAERALSLWSSPVPAAARIADAPAQRQPRYRPYF